MYAIVPLLLEPNSTNITTVERETRAHTIYFSLSMSYNTKDQRNFAACSVRYYMSMRLTVTVLAKRGVIFVKISKLLLRRILGTDCPLARTFRIPRRLHVFPSADPSPCGGFMERRVSRVKERPIFAVAKAEAPQHRGKDLENWRTTGSHRRTPAHSPSRASLLSRSLLNYYDFLLLLLSLQCFTIVKCYDTSRPRPFSRFSCFLSFFFLQPDSTTVTAL